MKLGSAGLTIDSECFVVWCWENLFIDWQPQSDNIKR